MVLQVMKVIEDAADNVDELDRSSSSLNEDEL
jgi:hypothetical protein